MQVGWSERQREAGRRNSIRALCKALNSFKRELVIGSPADEVLHDIVKTALEGLAGLADRISKGEI